MLIPYTIGDDAFDAFISRPDGPGPHPAVLVCHPWGGRNAFAEGRAKRLAELGYVGAAVDLYGVGKRGTDRETSVALMSELMNDPPKLRARLEAAYDTVRAAEGVDAGRMGAIGFCFAGMCAILMARMGLPLRGVASFHGILKIGEALDAEVAARILVLHGQDDPMAPPEDVGAFAAEMKRVGADWQLCAYPGAVHAFAIPGANQPEMGIAYDPSADRRSWAEMTRFFEAVFGEAPAGAEAPRP